MEVDVDSLSVEKNDGKKNDGAGRFEIRVDDHVAFASYRLREAADGTREIVFPHTEVPREFEGQGVGSKLVRGALDYAREQGLCVVPLCPFVKGYIERHPEYQDLVKDSE